MTQDSVGYQHCGESVCGDVDRIFSQVGEVYQGGQDGDEQGQEQIPESISLITVVGSNVSVG